MDQQLLEPIAKLGDRIVRVVSNVPVLMNCLLQAERSTGLDRRNIALIVSTIAVVIVLSSSITTDAIGMLYPLYMSVRAIEYKQSSPKSPLIAYWIIFFALKLVESLLPLWVIANIPFYSVAKASFYVWCYHPTTKGAATIMTKLILPHLAESALFVHSLLHSGIKDSISSSSDKGQHFLNCTVRRVQMDQERCVCCEVLVAASDDPDSKGRLHTSPTIEGTLIQFDYSLVAQSLASLDGFLELTLVEVPTFGKNAVLGVVRFELSRLIAGKEELLHFALGQCELEVELELYKDA